MYTIYYMLAYTYTRVQYIWYYMLDMYTTIYIILYTMWTYDYMLLLSFFQSSRFVAKGIISSCLYGLSICTIFMSSNISFGYVVMLPPPSRIVPNNLINHTNFSYKCLNEAYTTHYRHLTSVHWPIHRGRCRGSGTKSDLSTGTCDIHSRTRWRT